MRRFAVLFVLVFIVALVSASAQTQPAKPVAKPAAKAPATSNPNAQLLKLAAAGMGDDVLLATVAEAKAKKQKYDTSADALIALKDAGISQKVIAAVMGADTSETVPAVVTASREEPSKVSFPKNAVGEVLIPDATEVKMRLTETVSSANAKQDQKLRFEAAEDVLINGRVVIAAGATGSGRVTVAEEKKNFGRRGKLDFTIDTVRAVDGQNIRLRLTNRVEGGEHYVAAGVLTYFTGVGGLFIKGKDVTVDAGTEYSIYIDGDKRITLKAVPSK